MTSIERAVDRLEKSTGRIARRNARAALKKLLYATWKEYDISHPPIRKDGTEIVRVKKRGVCCPICDVPLKGFVELARHAAHHHGCHCNNTDFKCWCGKRFFNTKQNGVWRKGTDKFTRHLAGVGRENLKAHAVIGALGNLD
jgi:hypothetical protein